MVDTVHGTIVYYTNTLTCEEVGNFSRGQQVIDKYQELFIRDLGICEEKHSTHVLETCLDVQLS